jgi:cellulose synthase/poly-beta-1,6-N-acetylglucosamine synthase-like glycosyltransferase
MDDAGLSAPAAVVDLDLGAQRHSEEVDALDVSRFQTLWCLARRDDVPLGVTFWDVAADTTVLRSDLRDRVGRTPVVAMPTVDLPPPAPVTLTIAICTRDRPADLARALASLHHQSDPDFSVVVVDNAPRDEATQDVVRASMLANCEYAVEPRGGLARARNTAMAHVATDVVAWMDDDECADVNWVRRVKQGFNHPSRPAAVCGLMLPAELETEAQVRFEQYGGFNKGRGFTPNVLSLAAGTVRSPLYPLPSFGMGGNMAFRVPALREVGEFDPYLGPGTRTRGGEETKAFAKLLLRGGVILYWPPAIQWHYHRRDIASLRSQLSSYGAGLSAFIASMFADQPTRTVLRLAALTPTALRDARPGRANIRTGQLPATFPKDLARVGRQGFLRGAVDYVRERRACRAEPG